MPSKTSKSSRPPGRPSDYKEFWEDKLVLIEGWARSGLTNEEIAGKMNIDVSTLYVWQNKYVEFKEALKRNKEIADFEVEQALFKKAKDHMDVTAMIFWLKNRQPENWRDRKDTSEIDIMRKELELKREKLELEKSKLATLVDSENNASDILSKLAEALKEDDGE